MSASESQPVIATVTRGGRMRIPQRVLDQLRLKDGQQIVFFLREGQTTALVAPASEITAPEW